MQMLHRPGVVQQRTNQTAMLRDQRQGLIVVRMTGNQGQLRPTLLMLHQVLQLQVEQFQSP